MEGQSHSVESVEDEDEDEDSGSVWSNQLQKLIKVLPFAVQQNGPHYKTTLWTRSCTSSVGSLSSPAFFASKLPHVINKWFMPLTAVALFFFFLSFFLLVQQKEHQNALFLFSSLTPSFAFVPFDSPRWW